ncbi:hypothetical protein [Bacillus haynesii]|uniref:hypothetical protein n=1 Tax=Bacillus haynesii TaxID=1925021 RepID=UPI00227E724E|nr:hypothetical protein [Bacillus haynesii]MCY8384312.1 hypothetical protein [Bacillus haynesii]MCY9369657.1 hypothetical protein [Bacillus haynesii]MEC0700934.1 hypothetical protein [Bacillus haynesii]MEC0719339.1 hypothetical protein [Bacillus haynesii]
MLRLDAYKKFKHLPRNIKRHLIADEATSQDKWSMLFCIIVLLDLICGIPLFAHGEKIFTIIALPFMIFINLWTIFLMFTKLDKINATTFGLFKGGTGIASSICYLLLSLKYVHYVTGYNPILMITTLISYSIVTIGFIRYYVIVLPKGSKKENSSTSWGTYLLTLGPGMGYITVQFMFHFSDSIVNLFMSYIYLFLACFFSYMGIKFTHQYFFIKANQHMLSK